MSDDRVMTWMGSAWGCIKNAAFRHAIVLGRDKLN